MSQARPPTGDRAESPPGRPRPPAGEAAPIHLDRARFIRLLEQCREEEVLAALRERVGQLEARLAAPAADDPLVHPEPAGGTVSLRRDVLLDELAQIRSARSLRRARYYLRRLRAGAEDSRTSAINDINLLRWKEYDDVITDSLWMIERRDTSGAHTASYWGNFIPQIPRQMMLRYTKRGEWVLDPFSGSGTTLIECRRLGRNGLGVELNPATAGQARELIAAEANPFGVTSDVVVADSARVDFGAILQERGAETVQLLILHPPYHDIVPFSEDPRDLSNAPSVEAFLEQFGRVVERSYPVLDEGRYLAVVIGDKYAGGEWVPLGFYVMQAVIDRGYRLKSIVVKNIEGTRAKRHQQALWRYRALLGGFYVFKHEYVLVFQKPAGGGGV